MTRDVLISISGAQIVEEDNQAVEMITRGDYFLKNGSHYILYDEVQEGMEGVTRNTIKIHQSGMDIIKRGSTSVHMTFEKEKKNISCYATPFGELMIGIRTNDIRIAEEEDRLKVQVDYTLDINYQHVSECNIVLEVCSKDTANIHLLS
ncbi:DUF1934 domain-containing protein [Lacrimispora amygdalina]|uniref:DUF1934 domain-containing protein n=1 Tax=Lacrimispora amygdalina TaxID=253257 RepID=A0A3E2N697_9FIRM|nr:DUF1934 domain-containing protein [Clostridium indicum]RFZ76527.1 DUF1934 domain-containing protein [Clostridium indicum]